MAAMVAAGYATLFLRWTFMTITPSIPVASSNADDGSGTELGADHVPDVVLLADDGMSGANESSVVGLLPPMLRQTSEPVKVPGGTEGVLP